VDHWLGIGKARSGRGTGSSGSRAVRSRAGRLLRALSVAALLSLGAVGCAIRLDDPATASGGATAATPFAHLDSPVATRQSSTQPAAVPTQSSEPTETPPPTETPTPTVSLSATATALPTSTPTPLPPLVAIDPGHGGTDLGARHFDDNGHMDWTEAEVNLDVALRLRDLLVERGYRVLLTRDEDRQLHEEGEDVNGDGQTEYVVDENQARVDMVNASGADLLLCIHQNAYYGEGAADVGGTVTYYCSHRPFSDRNLRFAELVQEALVKAFQRLGHDVHDRGVRSDLELQTADHPGRHIIMLGPKAERIVRPCQVPGALSEALFITHRREAELARDPAALDALAVAYADAICAYFEEDATGADW